MRGSENIMWDIEPLEKVKWKEPQTMNGKLQSCLYGEAVDCVCAILIQAE